MKVLKVIIPILVIAALLLFLFSTYTVAENQYACVKRFSKVVNVKDAAGLAFKTPFVDSIQYIPKDYQFYDVPQSDVLTSDKKAMVVDIFVVWRINDPLTFIRTIGRISEMEERIDAAVYSISKNLIDTIEQAELISESETILHSDEDGETENETIKLLAVGEHKIMEEVKKQLSVYGVEIKDVKIKRLDLPVENEQAVYNRMISERKQIAERYRAEGENEAQKIRNEVDKQKGIILSEAKAQAEQLKAEGESEYMRVIAESYTGEDKAEFYRFVRALDALKNSMKGEKQSYCLRFKYQNPFWKTLNNKTSPNLGFVVYLPLESWFQLSVCI